MNPSVVALTVIFGIVTVGSVLGFYAGARHKMDLEQWTVAGRGFGLLLVWLLMAGEIYTTFSFLGASGWAYSKGGPTLYILGYLTLAYVVSFYILPQIWEVGRKYALQTEADFFERRYGSKYLAALVSLVGVVFMIPYLQLQLTGLGIKQLVLGCPTSTLGASVPCSQRSCTLNPTTWSCRAPPRTLVTLGTCPPFC